MRTSVPLASALAVLFLWATAPLEAQQPLAAVTGQATSATLAPDGIDRYALQLEADRFIAGRVEQEGVQVVITITNPEGERVGRFASGVGVGGPAFFQFTTARAGGYIVEITPARPEMGGAYRLHLTRSEPVATTPEGKVDQALAMFGEDTPGAAVSVWRNGQIVFARGYGMASLAYGAPFGPDTPTNIGSTSKHFTGFAAALLQARGLLSLDDEIRQYIPELPDFGETITIRHLLGHTSGYREFVNLLLMGGRQVMDSDFISRDEVITVVQRQPELQNAPGAEFNYNNTAFGLVAIAIERVTGQSFGAWMRDEVFRPLGMVNTRVRMHPGEIIPGASQGLIPADEGFREVRDLGASMGAGGIYSTVADLARWADNLATGRLGGPEVIQELTTSGVLNTGDETNYGLGIFLDTNRGLRRWQHGGSDIAHRSTFVHYPDLNAGYTVQSNYGAFPGNTATVVAQAFFAADMEEPAQPATDRVAAATAAALQEANEGEISVSRDLLARYVGRYEITSLSIVLAVTLGEEGLKIEVGGQPPLDLVPTSEATFTLEGAPANLTFHLDDLGEVTGLTLHQEGDYPAQKLPDEVEAVDLEAFVGRFFSAELEAFYTLTVEDNALVIRHLRFGPARLAHSEGDTFTGTLPVSLVVFERDQGGAVTGFRAGNGRSRDVRFERVAP
jgi:CubicO group peptidase (beta-lactamase class C family)